MSTLPIVSILPIMQVKDILKQNPIVASRNSSLKIKSTKKEDMLLPLDATDILLLVGIPRKKVARNIQLLPSSKKSLSFILIG